MNRPRPAHTAVEDDREPTTAVRDGEATMVVDGGQMKVGRSPSLPPIQAGPGILAGASGLDLRHSEFRDNSNNITIYNPPAPEVVAVTLDDVPRLVQTLVAADDEEGHSRVSAAENLLLIAKKADGPDHIITAITDAEVVPQLVSYLTSPGALRKHTVTILAYVLRSQKTWDMALNARVIPLLAGCLSDPALGVQVDAACALTHVTSTDGGKRIAVEAGTVPTLVVALGRPSNKLRMMVVRVVRNITSVDAGKRAAYASNAVPPLVAMLDARSRDVQVQHDAVKALLSIASLTKARKTIKKQGAITKLKGFLNAPLELQTAVDTLLDKL